MWAINHQKILRKLSIKFQCLSLGNAFNENDLLNFEKKIYKFFKFKRCR